jgi:hypothetical protein
MKTRATPSPATIFDDRFQPSIGPRKNMARPESTSRGGSIRKLIHDHRFSPGRRKPADRIALISSSHLIRIEFRPKYWGEVILQRIITLCIRCLEINKQDQLGLRRLDRMEDAFGLLSGRAVQSPTQIKLHVP